MAGAVVMAESRQIEIKINVEINQTPFDVISLDFSCRNCGLKDLKDSTPVKDIIKCTLCGQHYTILETMEGDFGESLYIIRRSSEKELTSINKTRGNIFSCVEWMEK